MSRLGSLAAVALAVALSALAQAASAATVFTQTFTLTNDLNSDPVASAVISGSWGVQFFSDGHDVIFSTVQVDANDQGQTFTYDFSYHCTVNSPGCTSSPTVPSQYPNASGFHVGYTVNTGELPPCLFPALGQTTTCSGQVHTSVSDFIFVSSGVGHLVETNSFRSLAPEPAEWALMLAGFGGLDAAVRRRRNALAV